MLPASLRVFAVAIALSAATPAQNVWTVDAATGGPGALAATVADPRVVPGDILRVRPGAYSDTSVDKALHILGEGSVVIDRMQVANIPAGNTLSLVNMSFVGIGLTGVDTPCFTVTNCAGGVTASSCSFAGRQQAPSGNVPANRVTVAVTNSAFFADNSSFFGTAGRDPTIFGSFYPSSGLRAQLSTVTLSRCTVTGGIGSYVQNGSFYQGQDGAPAILTMDGILIINNSSITGGTGGLPFGGIFCSNQPGGRGAAAIACSSLDQIVVAGSGTTLTGGFTPEPRCAGIATTPCVVGTGTINVDPAVRFVPGVGSPNVDPRMAIIQRPIGNVLPNQTVVNLNGFASWQHRDLPGSYVFTVLSAGLFPVVPHPVIFGGLNLDVSPGRAIIQGPLQVGSNGSVNYGFSIPFDLSLRGARLFFGTVSVDARLTPTATTPSGLYVSFQ